MKTRIEYLTSLHKFCTHW